MKTLRFLVVLWAALALAACEEKADRKPAEKAEKEAPTKLPEGGEGAGTEITVKLVEAGAEPRQALRYDFSAAKKQTVLMTMDMTMGMELGAMKQPPTKLPPVHMDMVIDPKKVSGDGVLRYAFEMTRAEVVAAPDADPNVVRAMKTELDKTQGMKGWADVTPRGFTLKADIEVPPGAGPQLRDLIDKMKTQIEQMSAPLPEEAVGKGAKWVVTQPIKNEMLKFTQTATYTLADLADGVATLEIGIAQDAPPQNIEAPGMAGATARLIKLDSSGKGNSKVDLKQLVPEADVSTSLAMEVEIRAQGQQQNMKTTIDIEMTTRPK